MVYKLLLFISTSFIFFGLVVGNVDLLSELSAIIHSPDYLITDYLEIAGVGGAFLNSGLLMLLFILLLKTLTIQPTGVSIASIMTIGGFALFGKNIFNVWPLVAGVFLYTLLIGENIRTYLYVALFGTALAPITTHLVLNKGFNLTGLVLALLIGFFLPPLASFSLTLHRGYNLYNIGFTAGLLGMFIGALLKAYNLHPEQRLIWHREHQLLLAIFIYALFYAILLYGLKLNNWSFKGYKNIFNYSGKLLTDFILLENAAVTFINIGILGLAGTTFVLLIGSELNGPTIGGIMTLAGFGALGKHPKNILPIVIGVLIGAFTNAQEFNSPAMVLAVLFGTTLAPVAGEFGFIWGVIAGYLHSALVLNIGTLHFGMNLYNNGFSGGFVALFLLPIIDAFKNLKDTIIKNLLEKWNSGRGQN
ncbi:Protein of unknown function [Fervidobacterium changbaicum]|uniref:DUF1576 domain-containing protein n=2 Tax=Fervidobacterium TaxID=2422 RepID=A0AAI8GCW1_FERIS|nr:MULTISPECIES: DUF1576 domain-containing protein [Fervidobacterium]AMW32356.1 DUF1576 domain-containing protein [Fervidobacterium islandicum]QAV32293.1 DUF1576 domain-containing protein [Fervidobacterium changbaicum]QAV34057.1 DUF1576 domain-containing protein [Fervidobacterium changbaicum]SDH38869.1 Protein of unknown function [Fervidobacterium changbaicum]